MQSLCCPAAYTPGLQSWISIMRYLQAAPLQLHRRQVRRERALPAGGRPDIRAGHRGQDRTAPLCAEKRAGAQPVSARSECAGSQTASFWPSAPDTLRQCCSRDRACLSLVQEFREKMHRGRCDTGACSCRHAECNTNTVERCQRRRVYICVANDAARPNALHSDGAPLLTQCNGQPQAI